MRYIGGRGSSSSALVEQFPERPREGGIKTYKHDEPDMLETRKKLMSEAIEAAGTGSTSKGSTSITQIVQHVNPEPTSELEYAERIRADIEKISNPHLMVTILNVLQARMADIKKDYQGRS